MLNRSLPLLKQRQSEPGKLLLKRCDLRFQAGDSLDDICKRNAGRSHLIRPRLARGRSWQVRDRAILQQENREKVRKGTPMLLCHLLKMFLRHAFDASVGRMGRERDMSFCEPVVQGFRVNPKQTS